MDRWMKWGTDEQKDRREEDGRMDGRTDERTMNTCRAVASCLDGGWRTQTMSLQTTWTCCRTSCCRATWWRCRDTAASCRVTRSSSAETASSTRACSPVGGADGRARSMPRFSVPTRWGKVQGAREIGHNLARERPKFWHNLLNLECERRSHARFYARTTKIWSIFQNFESLIPVRCLDTSISIPFYVELEPRGASPVPDVESLEPVLWIGAAAVS